jgi:hypothetical protein
MRTLRDRTGQIAGVAQPQQAVVETRVANAPDEEETHGYDFVSAPLAPGTHTAMIQWRDNDVGSGCVVWRSLVVLHT